MTHGSNWTLVALAAFALLTVPTPAAAEEAKDEKELFVAQKCNLCHSIDSAGVARKSEKMKGADLSAVGTRHDAEWIGKFLRKEADIEGEKHKKTFTGTPEELTRLAEWLATLKSE